MKDDDEYYNPLLLKLFNKSGFDPKDLLNSNAPFQALRLLNLFDDMDVFRQFRDQKNSFLMSSDKDGKKFGCLLAEFKYHHKSVYELLHCKENFFCNLKGAINFTLTKFKENYSERHDIVVPRLSINNFNEFYLLLKNDNENTIKDEIIEKWLSDYIDIIKHKRNY